MNQCRVYWGSHGCRLERDHDGPCLCDCAEDPIPIEPNVKNVGGPPYYGPETNFYGEDATPSRRETLKAFLA